MVSYENNVFHLQTQNTSYLIGIRNGRYLEQLYYGKKIRRAADYEALFEKVGTGYGNSNVTPVDSKLTLDNLCLEYSFAGTGDYKNMPMTLQMPDQGYSNNFLYAAHKIYKGIYNETELIHMPHARDNYHKNEGQNKGSDSSQNKTKLGNQISEKCGCSVTEDIATEDIATLDITLSDSVYPVELHLIYTVFPNGDVITRRVKVQNNSKAELKLDKIMSMMLDLPTKDYLLHTFDGLWIRERQQNIKKLISGIYINESTTGTSSNRHNPFIMLTKEDCKQEAGECYGFHLIYSGNHYEAVEVSGYGKLRVMAGISPHQFHWILKEQEAFYTPEAVLTYSNQGQNGLSQRIHHFINNHIIAPEWSNKERPILINNWEATYFDFNDKKLLEIAKEAKQLGMEMFVLDDGWFSNRSDDTSSLGDWAVNETKLGQTLDSLVKRINEIGLKFGLWFEPEMISEKSSLYQMHPDWAVKAPDREAYVGRNQLILDLTRHEVRSYMIQAVSKVLESAPIEYVKWDMNRNISDAYSFSLGERQGEFFHRYVLGLYEVMEAIVKAFPHILFEGCSAGGNRFDLGILYFMPQIWTSDDTDANERTYIQEGTSFGYPLSTMTSHVSAVPNHQTLRTTSIETRFHIACFGVLGYEIDITKLSKEEKQAISHQISFYKRHRRLFQFGTFYRLETDDNHVSWQVVSEDRTESVVMLYQRLAIPNPPSDILKMVGLLEEEEYVVKVRKQDLSTGLGNGTTVSILEENESEEYQSYGDLLMNAGIKLSQQFAGIGWSANMRRMGDFSSQLYEIRNKKEQITDME
jgi:alpha-galactosidase